MVTPRIILESVVESTTNGTGKKNVFNRKIYLHKRIKEWTRGSKVMCIQKKCSKTNNYLTYDHQLLELQG